MMLEGTDEAVSSLRRQTALVEIVERRFTKVGFHTIFNVKDRQVKTMDTGRAFVWGDVIADVDGIVVAFELHLRDGYIFGLEGFTVWRGFVAQWATRKRRLQIAAFD